MQLERWPNETEDKLIQCWMASMRSYFIWDLFPNSKCLMLFSGASSLWRMCTFSGDAG